LARPDYEITQGAKLLYGHDETDKQALLTDTGGRLNVIVASGLVPSVYDYISLTYTSGNLTGVVYKTGGSGGTTVATFTLAYTGSQLDSITKT
jgi:hypothetical protein